MDRYYTYVKSIKETEIKKYTISNPKWKEKVTIPIIFWILAIVVAASCYLLFSRGKDVGQHLTLSFPAIGLLVGVVFGQIPFFIGVSIYNKAKIECGRPYSYMIKEFLFSNYSGIQFGYHNKENKSSLSMDVYQIPYQNIVSFEYDENNHIMTIVGTGELVVYNDIANGRIDHIRSSRKFYNDSRFSFIFAFSEIDEFLALLNSKIEEV